MSLLYKVLDDRWQAVFVFILLVIFEESTRVWVCRKQSKCCNVAGEDDTKQQQFTKINLNIWQDTTEIAFLRC